MGVVKQGVHEAGVSPIFMGCCPPSGDVILKVITVALPSLVGLPANRQSVLAAGSAPKYPGAGIQLVVQVGGVLGSGAGSQLLNFCHCGMLYRIKKLRSSLPRWGKEARGMSRVSVPLVRLMLSMSLPLVLPKGFGPWQTPKFMAAKMTNSEMAAVLNDWLRILLLRKFWLSAITGLSSAEITNFFFGKILDVAMPRLYGKWVSIEAETADWKKGQLLIGLRRAFTTRVQRRAVPKLQMFLTSKPTRMNRARLLFIDKEAPTSPVPGSSALSITGLSSTEITVFL